MTQSAKGLFRARLSAPDASGCENWQGCFGSDGYGHVRWNRKVVAAHRLALMLESGSWPEGHVLHSCDNPACCNPKHLKVGTHQENMAECSLRMRNRTPRPGNGRAKLSPDQLTEIRRRFAQGENNKSALAREFGVTPPRIRQVVNK